MGSLLDHQGFVEEQVRTLSSGQIWPSTAACWCFDTLTSFRAQEYEATIDYAGHAERWNSTGIGYDPAAHNSTVVLVRGGKKLAVTTAGHDWDGRCAGPAFERELGG